MTHPPGSFESTWHRATTGVVADVLLERSEMLDRWGDPTYPSVVEISPSGDRELGEIQTGVYGLPPAREARAATEASRGAGTLTWGRIATQSLADAVAATDEVDRRAQIVQLAAVALAWVEDLDRRRRAQAPAARAPSVQETAP